MASSLSRIWISDVAARKAILVTAGLAMAIILGSVSGRMGGLAAVGLLAALLLVPLVVARPFVLLVALILSAFCCDYLQFVLNLPRFISWLQPAAILFLLILAFAQRSTRQETWSIPWPVAGATVAVLAIILFSMMLNGTDPGVALAGSKNYLAYPLLFLAVVILNLRESERRIIEKTMLGLILMQLPIVILQRYSFLPGAAAATSGVEDFAGGTLGANTTGILSLLCMGVAGIALALIVFEGARLEYLIVAVLSIIPPCLAEGKIAFFLLPIVVFVVLGLTLFLTSKGSWRRALLMIFVATILVGLVLNLMPLLAPASSLGDLLSSRDALWLYLTQIGGDPVQSKFGRLTDIAASSELISRNLLSFLLGFGPGSLSATGQAFSTGLPFGNYLSKGIGGTQFSATLLETGLLGTIGNLLLPLAVLLPALRFLQVAPDRSSSLRLTSFVVVFVIYILGVLYSQPWWSAALSTCFWVFAGDASSSVQDHASKEEAR